MKLEKMTWVLSVLVFMGGPILAAPDDEPPVQANQNTTYTDPANTSPHRYVGQGTPMAVMPPTGWKTLSGKVKSFDRVSETLQLRDKVGNLYLVPIDSQVTISRDGKRVAFTELRRGDRVVLHMTRSK